MDERLGDQTTHAFFQVALLYTSSNGERRIRVHTLALPVTVDPATVFHCADGQAIAGLVAKMGWYHVVPSLPSYTQMPLCCVLSLRHP